MKKLVAVLLALVMALSLVACGGGGGKKAEPLADENHEAWVAHGQFLLADGTLTQEKIDEIDARIGAEIAECWRNNMAAAYASRETVLDKSKVYAAPWEGNEQ